MRSLEVNFVEYNIDKDKGRRDELQQKTGRTSVPGIDVEGTLIRGYNPEAIQAALDRSAR